MATQVQSPLDLVQAPVATQTDLPDSGFSRLYAGTDGQLYLRQSSGESIPLSPEFSELFIAVGRLTIACRLLGVDPKLVDAEDAIAALTGLL